MSSQAILAPGSPDFNLIKEGAVVLDLFGHYKWRAVWPGEQLIGLCVADELLGLRVEFEHWAEAVRIIQHVESQSAFDGLRDRLPRFGDFLVPV